MEESPSTPPTDTKSTTNTSPTTSESSGASVVDPPGYIAPNQQDMLLTDITSAVLHSGEMTQACGRGAGYLSSAASFPETWPVTGVIHGLNKRLMINLVCQRVSRRPDSPLLNVYFLVNTGSPCSYLCPEALSALINIEGCNLPSAISVLIHSAYQEQPFEMHMSPQGTTEEPGKFRDVNVLGMDFLLRFSMTVDGQVKRFKLFRPTLQSLRQDPDYNFDDF